MAPPTAGWVWNSWRRDPDSWQLAAENFGGAPGGEYHRGCISFVTTCTNETGVVHSWSLLWGKQTGDALDALYALVEPLVTAGREVFAVEFYGTRTVSGSVGAWEREFTGSTQNFEIHRLVRE